MITLSFWHKCRRFGGLCQKKETPLLLRQRGFSFDGWGLPPFGRRCRDRGLLSTPESSGAPLRALVVLRPSSSTQASLVGFFGHKKTPSRCLGLSGVGGPKRIRTAVAAFAELSLATRPSDPFQSGEPPWACEYTKVGCFRFHFWGINSGKTLAKRGVEGCSDGLDLRHEHVEMGAQCIDPWQLAGWRGGVLGGGVGIVFGRSVGGRLGAINGVLAREMVAGRSRVARFDDGGGGVGTGHVVRCVGRLGGAQTGGGRSDGCATRQLGGCGDRGRGTGHGGDASVSGRRRSGDDMGDAGVFGCGSRSCVSLGAIQCHG